VLLVWLLLSVVLMVAMSGGWGTTFQAANLRFAGDGNPGTSLLLAPQGELAYLTLAVGSGCPSSPIRTRWSNPGRQGPRHRPAQRGRPAVYVIALA